MPIIPSASVSNPFQFVKSPALDSGQAMDQFTLAQKQQIIDALKQSALNPQPTPQYGAIASRTSPITPIIQALMGYKAGKDQSELNKQYSNLFDKQYEGMASMFGAPQQTSQGVQAPQPQSNDAQGQPQSAAPVPIMMQGVPNAQYGQQLAQSLTQDQPVSAPRQPTMNPFGIDPATAMRAYMQDPNAYTSKVIDYYAKQTEPMNLREGGTAWSPTRGVLYTAPKDGIQITPGPQGPIASTMPGYNEAQAARLASNKAAEVSQTPQWTQNSQGQTTPIYATPPAARGIPTAPAVGGGGLQTTSGKASQEALGKASSDYAVELNSKAAAALEGKRTLSEMNNLLQGFNPGKFAPVLTQMGSIAQALGVSPDTVQGLTNINPGDAEAFQKGTAALATESAKQVSNRVTQMEFKTFLANNPNWMMTSNGIKRVMDYMNKGFDAPIEEQKQFAEWSKTHDPGRAVLDFPAAYNAKRAKEIAEGKANSAPAAFSDTKTKTDVNATPGQKVKVTTKAEYDQLKPGTHFIGPDGLEYVRH